MGKIVFKVLKIAVVILLVGGLLFIGNFLNRLGPLPTGYVAHSFCSNLFVSKRNYHDINSQDITALQRRLTSTQVNGNSVVSSFGFWPIGYTSISVYRPGLGCGQLAGETMAALEGPTSLQRDIPREQPAELEWPKLVRAPEGVNTKALKLAMDQAFADIAEDYEDRQNTRALIIFHKGQLIAEQYGEGFTPHTPLNSWSMTKSATSALIGILVKQGKINLQDKAQITGWDGADDLRSKVTIEHLLQMTSGLKFNEGYESDPISDVQLMLMNSRDLPAYAAKFPVTAEPGTRWSYQTASPVLLGRIIRDSFDSDEQYYHFPQRALFNKLGMRNAYYQADGAGTYVGGAFLYATARDWARFGLLYLNDGIVNGERILPEGWVEYSHTPTDASMKARAYGAQFWLNDKSANPWMPSIPEDAYAAQGHYGQAVIIIPSRVLVVVRMGQTYNGSAWNMELFLSETLAALPE